VIKKTRRVWLKPLRTCRWLNECYICGKPITSGQHYYDGGFDFRAHEECANKRRDEYESALVKD